MRSLKHRLHDAKRALKKTFTAVVAAAIAMPTAMLGATTAYADDQTPDTVTLTVGKQIWYTGWNTNEFYLDGNIGYCAQPAKPSPLDGKYKAYSFADPEAAGFSLENHQDQPQIIANVMYYGYGGPGFEEGKKLGLWPEKNWEGNPMRDSDYVVAAHILISDLYAESYEDAIHGTSQSFKDWVAKYIIWQNSPDPDLTSQKKITEHMVANDQYIPYFHSIGFYPFIANVGDSAHQAIASFKYQPTGKLKLKKASANTTATSGNAAYSLDGAVYTVYDKDGADAGKLIVDENGESNTLELNIGEYTVRETESPMGYLVDEETHTVTVGSAEEIELDVREAIRLDDQSVKLQKSDLDFGAGKASGGASLNGAQFQLTFYKKGDSTPSCSAVFETNNVTDDGVITLNDDSLVSGDWIFKDSNNEYVLPLGILKVTEVKAPEGYVLNKAERSIEIYEDNGDVLKRTYEGDWSDHEVSSGVENKQAGVVDNVVKRSDIEFNKKQAGTMTPLANVPFLITSKTTGEQHIVVTDDNGYINTANDWAEHSSNTNANDPAGMNGYDPYSKSNGAIIIEDGKPVVKDDSKLDNEAGVWFSGRSDEKSNVDNNRGALPYDTYTIKELRCEANKNLDLVEFDLYVTKNNVTYKLGTLDDENIDIATTLAYTNDIDSDMAPSIGSVELTDVIRYSGLKSGKEYTVKGELHEVSADGTDLGVAKNSKGEPITANGKFTANNAIGQTEVKFNIDDASKFAGTNLVAFEKLYDANGELVASHEDPKDEDQTIHVPGIKTTLNGDDRHEVFANLEEITLTDTVEYKNLVPGTAYTMNATLHEVAEDGTDAGEVKDSNGNVVTGTAEFTPEKSDGTVDVTYKFKADVRGKTVVAFEDLNRGSIKYATHADINDKNQTVNFPKINTLAASYETDDHDSLAAEKTKVKDTVYYSNLTPGKSYKVSGTIHKVVFDKDGNATDGGVLTDKDGNEITSESVFTPSENSGSAVIDFEFSSSDLAGQTVVLFEKLYDNGYMVAAEVDPNYSDQYIEFPGVKTTALDSETNSHEGYAKKESTVIDSVAYTNLKIGGSYKVDGVLHVKGTEGEDLGVLLDNGSVYDLTSKKVTNLSDGSEADMPELDESGMPVNAIKASKEFKPEAKDGFVDVEFKFDSTLLAGRYKTVAFEELYRDKFLVGVHADINDEDQTVSYPKIGTTLTGENGAKEVDPSKKITLTDTISYDNLVPGAEHRVTGELHVKDANGDAGVLKDKNGKSVTAEAVFTPEKPSGTVDVKFEFDASDVAGKELVAFEEMYSKGLVADHKDINDKSQTVKFKNKPVGELTQTGQSIVGIVALAAGVAALAYGGYRTSKRKQD